MTNATRTRAGRRLRRWLLPTSASLLAACQPISDTQTHSKLATFVSYATAPIVLVTATALLLGNLGGKHVANAQFLRALTGEYRSTTTSAERRANLRRQIGVFTRRMRRLWLATVLMHLALLCFLVTVLEVTLSRYESLFAVLGATTLLCGVLLLVASLLVQFDELRLSRETFAYEISDVLDPAEVEALAHVEHEDADDTPGGAGSLGRRRDPSDQ